MKISKSKFFLVFIILTKHSAFGAADSYECGDLLAKRLSDKAVEVATGMDCKLASAFYEDVGRGHKKKGVVTCIETQTKVIKIYETPSLDLDPKTCETQELTLSLTRSFDGNQYKLHICSGLVGKHSLGSFVIAADSFMNVGFFDPTVAASISCSFAGNKTCRADGKFKSNETIFENRGSPMLYENFTLEDTPETHLILSCAPMKW